MLPPELKTISGSINVSCHEVECRSRLRHCPGLLRSLFHILRVCLLCPSGSSPQLKTVSSELEDAPQDNVDNADSASFQAPPSVLLSTQLIGASSAVGSTNSQSEPLVKRTSRSLADSHGLEHVLCTLRNLSFALQEICDPIYLSRREQQFQAVTMSSRAARQALSHDRPPNHSQDPGAINCGETSELPIHSHM
ncbi:unnamed protein product [Protopolystoma xenopodis]|uniref:Uncharacterized protein n=1 Tax=Protopolystoma xenopodis TaxID=117903 RepID=A0A3S5FD18_9PLAT|nr:unnamed protein product [Protopolystoma xenopodis]